MPSHSLFDPKNTEQGTRLEKNRRYPNKEQGFKILEVKAQIITDPRKRISIAQKNLKNEKE